MPIAYPLLHVLLYLSLLMAPRDASRATLSGPGHAYELTRDANASDGWIVSGGVFSHPVGIKIRGDKLVFASAEKGGQASEFTVGDQVGAVLAEDGWSDGSRQALDPEHIIEKTPEGFRFAVRAGRADEAEYRIVYGAVGAKHDEAGRADALRAVEHGNGMRAFAEAAVSVGPMRGPAPALNVNVLGAVARPGAYSLPEGVTASEALGAAGDVTARADLPGSIILRGAGGELPQVIPFHPGVISRGEAVDIPLADRDTLYVPLLRKASQAGPRTVGAPPVPPASTLAEPAPETVRFGGTDWQAWRTVFEVREGGLVSLPRVRPGFDYGHWGHGRGPEIITNIGNPEWRDYRIDADLLVPGVDPQLNPHGLGLDFHGAMIAFHVVDRKESFNESGTSAYVLGFEGPGDWSLSAYRNNYCRQSKGWGNPGSDDEYKLAGGSDVALDPAKGNRFRIEVRGERIQVWIDGRKIADVVDERMGEVIGGRALDHGGVAFCGGFDAMIRLRSFEMTPLDATAARLRPRANAK